MSKLFICHISFELDCCLHSDCSMSYLFQEVLVDKLDLVSRLVCCIPYCNYDTLNYTPIYFTFLYFIMFQFETLQ